MLRGCTARPNRARTRWLSAAAVTAGSFWRTPSTNAITASVNLWAPLGPGRFATKPGSPPVANARWAW
jgi:hypothetical protein